MNTVMFYLIGCGYICLLLWGIHLWKKEKELDFSICIFLVIIGLIYDNFLIASGKFIGEGILLKKLSLARYWLHALFTPLLIVVISSICAKMDLRWAKKRFWKIIVFLLTIGLMFFEWRSSIFGIKLKAEWKNGVLTYEAVSGANLGMVIIITIIFALISLIFMAKFHFPWLLAGTFTMILGGILTKWLKGFPIMNLCELLFIASLLITKQFQLRAHFQKGQSA